MIKTLCIAALALSAGIASAGGLPNDNESVAYRRLEAERAELAATKAEAVAYYNWSTGTPDAASPAQAQFAVANDNESVAYRRLEAERAELAAATDNESVAYRRLEADRAKLIAYKKWSAGTADTAAACDGLDCMFLGVATTLKAGFDRMMAVAAGK